MLESHRLKIEELRLMNKSNQEKYLELIPDTEKYEVFVGEHRAIMSELADVREKLCAAYETESEEATIAMATKVDMPNELWTPELREIRDLGQKCELGDYFKAVVEGRPVGGAAAEYNQHVLNRNAIGDFPVEMLMDRSEELKLGADYFKELKEVEHRAVITGTTSNVGASANFLTRLFANSEAAFMNANMIPVGPGDHSFPIVAGTDVASDYDRNAAETPDGAITINTAVARRIQKTYEVPEEDNHRIPGIANHLLGDLRMALMAGLDKYVIGQLRGGLNFTPPANSTVETLSAFLARWGGVVDGVGARNVGDLRVLVNTIPQSSTTDSVFKLLSGLSLPSGGSHFWEMKYLSDPNYLRGSRHIPAAASKVGEVLFAKTGSNVRRLMNPIWRAGRMSTGQALVDRGRLQLSAVTTYTVALFTAVVVGGTDMHIKGSVRVEA